MVKIHILDAGHGDCLLVDCDGVKLLIDAGPSTFRYRKKISAKLAELLNGESVDIAFVTHNDDDHIGGFKYLIENKINIKRFVFNSLSNIKHVIKNSSNKISTKQDINLDRIVKDGSFVFSTLTSDDSPILIRNIKITPITPSKNILLKYLEQQERKNTEIKISSSSEKYSIKEARQLLSNGNDIFVKDPSATNKTSLSFMIEYGNFCGLFLGDAHEEDIYSYMANHCANRKISFNVVKLAHHGSEKNTSSRLLKLIGTTEYIICANKTKHNHPNNLTLARILIHEQEPKIHMSSSNQEIINLLNQINLLGFGITATHSENGVNTLIYE